MNIELLFTICSTAVLPAWLLLIAAPTWRWTHRLIHRVWIPGLLAVVYIYCVYASGPTPEGAGFGSLHEVMILFTSPYSVLAGWIHYLAFDLFIGAWEARDAHRRGISHMLVIPCLGLTFIAGPVGLLLYFCIRWWNDRSLTTVEMG